MKTRPPSPILDLLVVGGLTVDRFADGSSAPGGSVLHVARAIARRGLRVGIITVAGPEPEAQAGVRELCELARHVEVQRHETTFTFRHEESSEGRRLWLERLGGEITFEAAARDRITTNAILYAPVADEVSADALLPWEGAWMNRGAALQGWLRSTEASAEVEALTVDHLSPELTDALAKLDVLVASREDLRAEATAPADQLMAMRDAVGRHPVLVVTDAADGLWLDVPGVHRERDLREHFAVPRTIVGTQTVGAGDILAAFLTIGPIRDSYRNAETAMVMVAEELELRVPR
jgi:sugar/nucleoside kinase (ribokinase family)